MCLGFCVDDNLGRIASFVTRKSYRNQGIGKKVFKTCMERLGDRNISLDAETGKEGIYEKYGFNEASLSMLFFSFKANLNAIKNQIQKIL